MMKTDYEEFDAKVDRFLCRRMTPEEERAFQAELASSPELMERARVTALMIREMKELRREQEEQMADEMEQARQWCASSREKDQMAAFVDFESKKQPVAEVPGQSSADGAKISLPEKKRRLWPRVAVVAAAACVVGSVFTVGLRMHIAGLYRELATEEQYQAYPCDTPEDLSHFRGEPLKEAALLSQLYRKVQSGQELDSTILQLEQLYAEASQESSELYEFRDDLAWNLAFAYLKSGDGKKAIPLLEEMLKRNEPYPSLADPVRELLNKLYQI